MSGSSKGAFLTGFLLGGLTGAVAALIATPQSGEITRLQLRDKSIELRTKFDDLTSEAQERDRAAETPETSSVEQDDIQVN
jgi:gas vesicle protein